MQDLQTTLVVLVLVGFISLIIAGGTNKVVIYFNMKDFAISFAPWVTLLITVILISIYGNKGQTQHTMVQNLIMIAGAVIAAGFFIWSIKLSIFYNRSTALGIIVGLFKVVSALLGVLVVVSQIMALLGHDERKHSAASAIFSVMIIGLFVWLGKKLINGEQVYIEKGWSLPERAGIV